MSQRLDSLKANIQMLIDNTEGEGTQIEHRIEQLVDQADLSDAEYRELNAWLVSRAEDLAVEGVASAEAAEFHRFAADQLEKYGVETIQDLPPEVQEELATRFEIAQALVQVIEAQQEGDDPR
jgi:hypothetical protein